MVQDAVSALRMFRNVQFFKVQFEELSQVVNCDDSHTRLSDDLVTICPGCLN